MATEQVKCSSGFHFYLFHFSLFEFHVTSSDHIEELRIRMFACNVEVKPQRMRSKSVLFTEVCCVPSKAYNLVSAQ